MRIYGYGGYLGANLIVNRVRTQIFLVRFFRQQVIRRALTSADPTQISNY